jgi:hypothetical protein
MLCPLRYTGSIAFVIESINGFAERGHKIDVLLSNHADSYLEFQNQNVRKVYYNDKSARKGGWYYGFVRAVRNCAGNYRYDLIIGVSQMGLIAAAYMHAMKETPYVFYNDEIWFGNESSSISGKAFGRLMKTLERCANKRAMFTVTQDGDRAKFVSKANKISMKSFRYLPNSRRGGAESYHTKYLHRRFGFPPDTKIILWMGAVSQGDYAMQLAQLAGKWPEGYKMVFHFRTAQPNEYMREIMKYQSVGATYVSSAPIPYEDVPAMAASASIGLGLYADKGVNSRFIGASSGKINCFLKYGIPCIVNNYEGLKWVQTAGAGLCVERAAEVFSASESIIGEYGKYQNGCIQVYDALLKFDDAFASIAEEIENRLN